MKKILGLLIVASLVVSSVAIADVTQVYDLGGDDNTTYTEAFPVLKPSSYVNGTTIYTTAYSLNYTVTDSQNRSFEGHPVTNFDVAHVTFTTNNDVNLAMWYDIDGKATKNEAHIDLKLTISEYGIYYLSEDIEGVHNYIPVMGDGVEVKANDPFGVYYKGSDEYNEDAYYTTTDNWVGSFDLTKNNNHVNGSDKTDSSFFCLFQGIHGDFPALLEWDHFEFGFKEGIPQGGQPLPGLLMTLGLGGAAVAGISRKRRNRKA